MKRFIFMGDILRAGKVVIKADTKEEAVKRAEAGTLDEVYDEGRKDSDAGFVWNGDEDSIEEEE